MAITVESSAQADYNSSSVTITKPTGLTVGDLMVATIAGEDNAALTTLSGWTALQTDTTIAATVSVQYKIADSSDVAASNFTFTNSNSKNMAGAILRISGHAPTALFSDSGKKVTENTDVGSFSFSGDTISPRTDAELIIVLCSANQATAVGTAGNPDINGTDPTWTNFFNHNRDQGGGTDFSIGRAWYGTQTTAADITTMTAALTDDTTTDQAIAIATLSPQQNASGTHAFLASTPTFFDETDQIGVTGTHSLLAPTPTFTAPTVTATAPTQWQKPTKNTTTWVNKPKS